MKISRNFIRYSLLCLLIFGTSFWFRRHTLDKINEAFSRSEVGEWYANISRTNEEGKSLRNEPIRVTAADETTITWNLIPWQRWERPNVVPELEDDFDFDDSMEDFEGFDNEIGMPTGHNIIPNNLHFIIWKDEISFIEAICLLSAVINHNPDLLYIYTDRTLRGKYWNLLQNVHKFKVVVRVKKWFPPEEVFGQKLNATWKYIHGSDVARLQILMDRGGIFLETDTFVVRKLDEFRKFEMSLGWQPGDYLANQAIVAHKKARFLLKWFESYKNNYKSDEWLYNSRIYPTEEILTKWPHLIRRVTSGLCENDLQAYLLMENNDSWTDHYAIHLALRSWSNPGELEGLKANSTKTDPIVFNETNIKDHNCTLRQMVLSLMDYLLQTPILKDYPEFQIHYRD